MKTARKAVACTVELASTESTLTLAAANQDIPAPTVKIESTCAIAHRADTAPLVKITPLTIRATALTDTQEKIARNTSTGARQIPAKTRLPVTKLKTNILALAVLDGRGRCAMLRWLVARTLLLEKEFHGKYYVTTVPARLSETLIDVTAKTVIRVRTVKRKLTNANLLLARIALFVKTLLAPMLANAPKASKDRTAN